MLSYLDVQAFLKCLLPTIRKTRLVNLALLVSGMLHRRTLCLSELARSFPAPIAHQYKLKRLWRFVTSEALQASFILPALTPLVLARRPAGELLPLALDYTKVGIYQVLAIALPKKGSSPTGLAQVFPSQPVEIKPECLRGGLPQSSA